MYTSGQFAMIGNVGRKALRLYREEGLLVPALQCEENGYYYYDESQLSKLATIKRLRSIGISLFEIKQILSGEVSEEEILSSKIKETDDLLRDMKKMASDKKTGGEKEETDNFLIEPDIRPFEKCVCLYVDENVELEKLGISVGKLYEVAAHKGVEAAGSHFVRYDGLMDDAKFAMKTCLPVNDYRGEDTIELFEESCLHINFQGGFSKVSDAHKIMRQYAEEHLIELSDRVYEVYNQDMSVDLYYVI